MSRRTETFSQILGTSPGSIGHPQRVKSLALERDQGRLDHLARTDHKGLLVRQPFEDLPRQLNRDSGHGNRALSDLRLVLHALRRREGSLKKP